MVHLMGIHLFIRIWLYLYIFYEYCLHNGVRNVFICKSKSVIRAGSPEFANKLKSVIRTGSPEFSNKLESVIRAGSPEFSNKLRSVIRDGSTEREGS